MPKRINIKNIQQNTRGIFGLSPLGLLTLSACGGGETNTGSSSTNIIGNAVKGPLSNALIFLDFDNNGVQGNGEPSIRTGLDGSYMLPTNSTNYSIVAITDSSTIDMSSESVLTGVTLKAPSGALVVTPMTTLMQQGSLTADQVSTVLGLPANINLLSFNPFAADADPASALAVEKISHQIISVVNAFAAAAEGAGGSEADTFAAALKSVADVVKAKAAKLADPAASVADKSMDLTDKTDLALIKTQAAIEMAKVAGVNTEAFTALVNDTAAAIKNVNDQIEQISNTDLTSDATKNIFSIPQILSDQVKTAATNELAKSGSGSIAYGNEAPKVANAIANQILTEDSTLSLQFDHNVFSDVNTGDALTYSSTLSDGDVLPSWLSFDASNRLFSGIPLNSNVGTITLKVIATDTGRLSVSETFNLTVKNTNDAPTLGNAIADQTTAEDSALSFQFAANAFVDVDVSDIFIYTAALLEPDVIAFSDNNALPDWLAFDASTRTFSGTSLNGDVGAIAIKVTASDSDGLTVSDTFNLTVTNTNDAPIVYNAIADQTISEDSTLNFQFAANTFVDVDTGDSFNFKASLFDGNELPSWLSFASATRTFSGTPGNENVETITVKVTATDSAGLSVAEIFNLAVTNTNDAPIVTSTAVTFSTENNPYSYSFTASDVDGNDILTYAASPLPAWLSFNASNGVLFGTPEENDSGLTDIILTVTDQDGLSATQSLTILTTAGVLDVGNSYAGTLTGSGDKDWIAVDLILGQAYEIKLSGTSSSNNGNSKNNPSHDSTIVNCDCPACAGPIKQESNGTEIQAALSDPYLYIYDNLGNLVDSDDDGGSYLDSYIKLTASYSGTYYIEANSYLNNKIGDYEIDISEVLAPTNSPTEALLWENAAWNTSDTLDVYFADSGVIVSDGTRSTGFNQSEETSIMEILSKVTNFANIEFQTTETQDSADIRFAHADLGVGLLGYMFPQNYNSNEGLGVLTNSSTYWNNTSMQVGGFMYGVIVHEVGHGLGLAHPHDAGGGSQVMEGVSSAGDKGDYGQMNQSIYTVMSYNEGFEAHPLGLPSDYGSAYMASFAALDMAVLQRYYGANTTYNNGNTAYSLGDKDYYETIWDGGGVDEIIMSGTADSVIDLRAATLNYEIGGAGFVSYSANTLGGFTIANGVVIENAKGAAGSDVIIGNSSANMLYGGAGAGVKDILTGNGGADIFVCSLSDAAIDISVADIISDFTDGTDFIGLEDRSFSDLSWSNISGGTQIVDNDSNNILFWLEGVEYSAIDSSDFLVTDII